MKSPMTGQEVVALLTTTQDPMVQVLRELVRLVFENDTDLARWLEDSGAVSMIADGNFTAATLELIDRLQKDKEEGLQHAMSEMCPAIVARKREEALLRAHEHGPRLLPGAILREVPVFPRPGVAVTHKSPIAKVRRTA